MKQLPMIGKGGANMQHMNSHHHHPHMNNHMHLNQQVSEAYSMKASGGIGANKKHNTSFNGSKYHSNNSPSPSQTFFKGKDPSLN